MIGPNDKFKKHLSKIAFAKKRTEEIFADFGVPTEVAMASLSRAWEMLFDSICTTNDGSMGELKDISSVIQKLSSSQQKIQEIELNKLKQLKLAALDKEKEKLQTACSSLKKNKLPKEIVQIVEDQLSLL